LSRAFVEQGAFPIPFVPSEVEGPVSIERSRDAAASKTRLDGAYPEQRRRRRRRARRYGVSTSLDTNGVEVFARG